MHSILVSKRFGGSRCFECKLSLRYVTQHSSKQADECVRYGRVNHRQVRVEKLDEQVSDDDKSNGSKRIAEQLNATMKVGFRKYYMARHDKTRRKANRKSNKPCSYADCNIDIAKHMKILFTEKYVVGKVVNNNV